MNVGVIIPAAGSGTRMGGIRKPFIQLHGRALLQHCLDAFAEVRAVAHIVVVLPEDLLGNPPVWLRAEDVKLVPGGAHRAESVRNGLRALPDDVDVVVVHDAARPLVRPALIEAVIARAAEGASATVATPVTDTLHRVRNDCIVETPPRSEFWRAQTPQAFPRAVLEEAYTSVPDAESATDEAGLVAKAGFPVHVIPGDATNLKITTPEDLALAESAFASRGT